MSEELTDSDFESKLKKDVSVVLFYKDPCPYCKTMKKVIEKFEKSAKTLRTYQINGLENPLSTEHYGVERFPEVLFIKDGKEAVRQKGLTNPQGLKKLYREM